MNSFPLSKGPHEPTGVVNVIWVVRNQQPYDHSYLRGVKAVMQNHLRAFEGLGSQGKKAQKSHRRF